MKCQTKPIPGGLKLETQAALSSDDENGPHAKPKEG